MALYNAELDGYVKVKFKVHFFFNFRTNGCWYNTEYIEAGVPKGTKMTVSG